LTKSGSLTPLDYMISVINDPSAAPERRDRLAVCAAQYCHPRMVDLRKGKKDHENEAAESAGVNGEWAGDLRQ
jgi:hypothetical protein